MLFQNVLKHDWQYLKLQNIRAGGGGVFPNPPPEGKVASAPWNVAVYDGNLWIFSEFKHAFNSTKKFARYSAVIFVFLIP